MPLIWLIFGRFGFYMLVPLSWVIFGKLGFDILVPLSLVDVRPGTVELAEVRLSYPGTVELADVLES